MVFFHSIPCLIGEKVTKNILYSGSVFGFRPLQIFYELFFLKTMVFPSPQRAVLFQELWKLRCLFQTQV